MRSVDLVILPGDGIGPEIVAATRTCLAALDDAFGLGLSLTEEKVGFASLEAHGTTLTEAVVARIRKADGALLGPVSTMDYPPASEGGINPSAALRKRLDLYANMRPSRSLPEIAPVAGMDLMIVRENSEGFYADRNMAIGSGEFAVTEDVVLAVRKTTRRACENIVRAACRSAMTRCRHLTIVHKANVLKLGDGMFLETARRIAAEEFPKLAVDDVLVDAMASLLVREPQRFDVIVTSNMFGDILSNQAAELAGGLGLAASLNAGDACALAQAAHGSAPDIAGRNIANPASLIGSTAMLLDWIGARRSQQRLAVAGRALAAALDSALADPAVRTPDLGGDGTTSGMGKAVAARLASAISTLPGR